MPPPGDTGRPLGDRTLRLLGLAYLVVGIGFFAALLTDWVGLLTAVLVAILGLSLVSLLVIVRHEGLRTRENAVIGVFVVLAIALLLLFQAFTDLSNEVIFGVVFAVGIVVPYLLLER